MPDERHHWQRQMEQVNPRHQERHQLGQRLNWGVEEQIEATYRHRQQQDAWWAYLEVSRQRITA
jgi:hypothetical protein